MDTTAANPPPTDIDDGRDLSVLPPPPGDHQGRVDHGEEEAESLEQLGDLDDLDEPLPPPRQRLRMGPLTIALLGLVVLSAGFLGGALVQKIRTPAAAAPVAFAGRGAGATGTGTGAGTGTGSGRGGGAGAATGGSTPATVPTAATTAGVTGQVKLVDGTNLYVADASGNITKITTDGETKVLRSATVTLDQLQPGQQVTVEGTAGADGTTTGRTITVTTGG